ncbi:type II toxin-antitoxin system RelE/ParE family toxin [Liquorilactobacillus hordei]|uniref:type II toxin-antitoxin system RelE/ParE family toxin n=1 Tax=Liquorilactobacillus hordei TaxID=468911 RepID=UPI0039E7564A
MIKNFADKETEKIYNGKFSKNLPQDIQKRALTKLMMMEGSMNINDLRVPPSNHLEKLVGDREGQYSIAINNQYRICFTLENVNDFCDVEIIDYH